MIGQRQRGFQESATEARRDRARTDAQEAHPRARQLGGQNPDQETVGDVPRAGELVADLPAAADDQEVDSAHGRATREREDHLIGGRAEPDQQVEWPADDRRERPQGVSQPHRQA
jgi:hypothetical protein